MGSTDAITGPLGGSTGAATLAAAIVTIRIARVSDPVRCPDCGHPNPPGSVQCQRCNYPLTEPGTASPAPAPPPVAAPSPAPDTPDTALAAPAAAASESAAVKAEPSIPILLRRPRRRPRSQAPMLSIWLVMGLFAAAGLIWVAVQVNLDRRRAPVEGAGAEQQQRINALRQALERDSTDVQAHVGLGDVLYDTGNWSEAIVHYSAALRRDSTLVTALVDLGVCYYNLSQPAEAERMFMRAVARDPHQPVALFNLGIVNERRKQYDLALQFFHRALQSSPPADMQQPLVDAIQRIQKETGRSAPPLSEPR